MNDAWQAIVELLSREFLGIALQQWLFFLVLTGVLYAVLVVVVHIVVGRLERRAEQKDLGAGDYLLRLLKNTRRFGFLAVAVFLALQVVGLESPYAVAGSLRTLAIVFIFLQIGVWGSSLIDVLLEKGFQVARLGEGTARTSAGVVRWFALVVLWASVVLMVLGAFNVDITPLIAGLGIGGIAIAFALQHILSDIFCSVALVLDRPFEVGDFIIAGEHMGTVERIGIKTTRVRSLGGEQIIFPNSDLLGSRVRNFKRMLERRIVFGFGVLYATSLDNLERIPALVQEIVQGIDQTRFDRAHFHKFGDSALQFEVCYYVLAPDYNLYMDIQQRINLELLRRLQELGVEMAFPSRTIYFDRESAAGFNGLPRRGTGFEAAERDRS